MSGRHGVATLQPLWSETRFISSNPLASFTTDAPSGRSSLHSSLHSFLHSFLLQSSSYYLGKTERWGGGEKCMTAWPLQASVVYYSRRRIFLFIVFSVGANSCFKHHPSLSKSPSVLFCSPPLNQQQPLSVRGCRHSIYGRCLSRL